MNPHLPAAVVDFGHTVEKAIRAAGGVDLARRAEHEPEVRDTVVPTLLEPLGLGDLDPRSDLDTALAAAQVARLAGAYGLPYPVAARLAAPAHGEARFLTLVDVNTPRVEHGDLDGPWRVADATGTVSSAAPVASAQARPPSATYDVPVGLTPTGETASDAELALPLLLESWRMLGAAETALSAAVEHVQVRRQFDRALARFQGVQFRVADVEVSVRGLRQLAQFTTWRWFTAPDEALVDGLALRVQAIETVRFALNTSHLLHGAVGFCDEHDLAVLDMAVTPATRHPWDLESTTELLARSIAAGGFASPFNDPSCPTVEQRRNTQATRKVSS